MTERGMNELQAVLDDITAKVGPPTAETAPCPPEDAQRAQLRARLARIADALPKAFQWARLGTAELRRAVQLTEPLEAVVEKMRFAERVVLTGDAGSGKTSLAVAGLRAHLESGRKGLFVPAFRLASARSRSALGREAPDVVAALETELLVLDELGSEPLTTTSAVTDVLYERHLAGARTWVTTPFDAEQIARRYGDGIARRVFGRALHLELGKQ